MAFTLNTKYLWPPNSVSGGPNQRKLTARWTGIATDASNAADSVIVDKSGLTGPNGVEPTSLVIEQVEWSIAGFAAVIIEWDDTTDEEALRLTGADFKDYTKSGGLYSDGSAGTGDLLLTTLGGAANASFDISMTLRLKA